MGGTVQQGLGADRLTDLRNIPWTAKGWTIWQRGDSEQRKREVWRMHKQTGLSDTLTALIQVFGPPEAMAIRRTGKQCPDTLT